MGVLGWLVIPSEPSHIVTANLGPQFCRAGAILGICSAIYFVLVQQLRLALNRRLIQIHFWMSAVAALLQPLLVNYFDRAAIPGHSALSLLMNSFVGATAAGIWALFVFLVAQFLFITNTVIAICRKLSGSNSQPN